MTSRIATRFFCSRQLVSYPFILLSMVGQRNGQRVGPWVGHGVVVLLDTVRKGSWVRLLLCASAGSFASDPQLV